MNYFRQKRNPFQLINGTPASFANFCKWGGGGAVGLLRILSDVKTQDVFGSCGVQFWVQGFWGLRASSPFRVGSEVSLAYV